MKNNENNSDQLQTERQHLVAQLDQWLETPMLVLGFIWLVLLVIEMVGQLTPFMETVGLVIWIIFLLDFIARLALSPDKTEYLKQNWLTSLALALPALRVFRIFRMVRILRAARATRGLRLVRLITSLNRGVKSLGRSMGRRGFGYVVALSLIITVSGAAGMYTFERDAPGGFSSYGEALWWTAMLLITVGSAYWPQTAEGRVLCFLLALYGFAVFGYVTAALATFFIESDAGSTEAEIAGARSVGEIKNEIEGLRQDLRTYITSRQR